MIVTEETKAIAQQVYDFLMMNPKRHDQGAFIASQDAGYYLSHADEDNICGTTMCAAGATVYLTEGLEAINRCIKSGNWISTAAHHLGIEYDEAMRIFFNMDEETALHQILAIANGDQEKFDSIEPDEG